MEIELFRDRCIGAGNCVEVAPRHFDLDDEGLVVATTTSVAAGDEVEVRRAADICPAMAIELTTAPSS